MIANLNIKGKSLFLSIGVYSGLMGYKEQYIWLFNLKNSEKLFYQKKISNKNDAETLLS